MLFSNFRNLSLKNDYIPLLKLAIPLIIFGVIQSSVGFFANLFLAHLGEKTLAAGALVQQLVFTLNVFIFGIFSAINILVAYKYGAKDQRAISLVLRDGLLIGVVFVIPTFLIFWNGADFFVLLGQRQELILLAQSYLHGLAWGLLPKFILIILFDFLIGLGHTRTTMIFTILTIPLYIFFSYILIFGKFGFPELAIAGAGWGLTIGDLLATTMLCIYLVSHSEYRNYIVGLFTFERPFFVREISEIGLPVGLMFTLEVGFFFIMALWMGSISIQSLAANQIVFQFLGIFASIFFCIAQAITVRMGHELGANHFSSADHACFAGILVSAVLMFVVGLLCWFQPERLIAVDFDIHDAQNFQVVEIAKKFLFIAAIFQIIESIRVALFGALRGLKDTKFTLLVSFISYWCISLPLGYVFYHWFNLDADGIWWGMVVGASISVWLLYERFERKMKKYNVNESINKV